MDTIRMKIHLLKVETSETINRLLNMETAAVKNVELVKEREVRLRALMKEVSKKENELDKLQASLAQTDKKIKEVDHSLYVAKEEAHHLQANIQIKEEEIKINEQNFSPRAATLVKEAARADEAEKIKKELENKGNFCEEKIDGMEGDLMQAKKTMRETHEKYDETSKRIAIKEKKLEMAKDSAERAEKKLSDLEKHLNDLARQMGNKECSREKIGKKEEGYKNQLRQLQLRLKEAEHRADLQEEEEQRMGLIITQINEEKQIISKMMEHKKSIKK